MIGPGYEGYAMTRQNPNRARIRSVFDGFRNFGSEQQQSGSRETGNGTSRWETFEFGAQTKAKKIGLIF